MDVASAVYVYHFKRWHSLKEGGCDDTDDGGVDMGGVNEADNNNMLRYCITNLFLRSHTQNSGDYIYIS